MKGKPMDDLESRRVAVERILEDESLTAELLDPAARVLLDWGTTQARTLAGQAEELDTRLSDLRRTLKRIARQAGYHAVCSAYGGLNFPGDDGFHLLRIGVDDDLIGLKNAATGDPRKLRRWGGGPTKQYDDMGQRPGRLTSESSGTQAHCAAELTGR